MRQPLAKTLLVLVTLVVLVGLLGLALAGCGSEERVSPGAPSRQTSTESGPAPWPTEGSSPARLAGDGRYFGSVRAADAKSQPPTISFDVAQFFFGKDVQKAAEADGVVAPGEPVSNDHYARDPNAESQTLKVARDAEVTAARPVTRLTVPAEAWARCRSGCMDGLPVSLAVFFSSFEKKGDWGSPVGGPFWVTIRDGLVVRIDEQYFP